MAQRTLERNTLRIPAASITLALGVAALTCGAAYFTVSRGTWQLLDLAILIPLGTIILIIGIISLANAIIEEVKK